MATARESDRLRTLLETGIAISSELSLDTVLERIVDAAAALTGARYAALGVIDRTGTALERFVTTGVDEETRAAIGDLPRLLDLVATRLRELVGARLVAIALPVGENELRVEAAAGERSGEVVAARIARSASKAGAVLARKR